MGRALLVFVIVIAKLTFGQQSDSASWQDLIKAGKCDVARSLCTGWVTAKDTGRIVEAHKCLANVALCGRGNGVAIQANDVGGGFLAAGYDPEAVDEALAHLNQALKLAPQDLSIHQGRLHVLEVSFRYSDMVGALEESCNIYKGPEGVDPWLAYTYELFDAKEFKASLALLNVLERHYPNSHDVLGNIGAMYLMLKEDDEGIRYLLKAVEIAPTDPIDTWNLGRAYDYTGKVDLADQWYQKALALDADAERKKQNTCMYAAFVNEKLHDAKRACELEVANCPAGEQSACAAK